MVWSVFLGHFGHNNTNQTSLECHSTSEYLHNKVEYVHQTNCYYFILPATFSNIMHHATKQSSSPPGFMNTTVFFSGFRVTGSKSSGTQLGCGRIKDNWKCTWKLCRNSVMQSCHHVPESQRSVFSILWNPCHVELPLFREQKNPTQYYSGVSNKVTHANVNQYQRWLWWVWFLLYLTSI